ncbi:MAG: MBL fold metallo-hydrolase [Calditrichaeota bacterium]|nr:MBL fold metallo-hydrolase [Calditrichota bacterium]
MKITFHGAAGGVTGSKHLIEAGGKRVLLDCGMFQGRRSEALELNWGMSEDLSDVDAVVLSHAHLDHCGLLPLLVNRGYKGPIFTTPTTRDISELILKDSASIQENDRRWLEKEKIPLAHPAEPLYESDDIPATMAKFREVSYASMSGNKWTTLLPGVRLKLYNAGHILGSAWVMLEFDGESGPERVAFSGDVGRFHTPLLKDPEYSDEEAPVLLMESTYGNREHKPRELAYVKLRDAIRRVTDRRGKIVIPAFALGRTQELIYVLHRMHDQGSIPDIPIYVDSPLGINMTAVYRAHRDEYDLESKKDFPTPGDYPLVDEKIRYTRTVRESMQLNDKPGPYIVIASSGMMEGGRIRHHLRHTISDEKNLIMVIGYQAEHTLGRRLVEREPQVRMFNDWYDVRAEVITINEFSAHADAKELHAFADRIAGLKKVFLVHGEHDQAVALRDKLLYDNDHLDVTIPQQGESVLL